MFLWNEQMKGDNPKGHNTSEECMHLLMVKILNVVELDVNLPGE